MSCREQDNAVRVSYGAVEVLPIGEPRPRCRACHPAVRCCCPGDVSSHCKSAVFLLAQGVFAWCVGLLLLAAVALSVALLPLCGLGVLVFTLLFSMGIIDFLAKCDAALVNYVSPPENQIQIDPRASDPLLPLLHDGGSPERLTSGLLCISAESSMVLIYLLSVKLVLATIGLFVVCIVIVLPLLLLDSLLWGRGLMVDGSSSWWEALCAYTAMVLVFLVAVMSMDLIVDLCGAATRFFCCEHVYTLSLPRRRSSASSRPNVVVVRIPPSSTSVYTFASATVAPNTNSAT